MEQKKLNKTKSATRVYFIFQKKKITRLSFIMYEKWIRRLFLLLRCLEILLLLPCFHFPLRSSFSALHSLVLNAPEHLVVVYGNRKTNAGCAIALERKKTEANEANPGIVD